MVRELKAPLNLNKTFYEKSVFSFCCGWWVTESRDEKRHRGGVNKLQDGGRSCWVQDVSRCGLRNESMALVFECNSYWDWCKRAEEGGTGTELNKARARQLEQEARKERVFHPEEDWRTHWDCDKTATQSLQRPPIVRGSNTHTHTHPHTNTRTHTLRRREILRNREAGTSLGSILIKELKWLQGVFSIRFSFISYASCG